MTTHSLLPPCCPPAAAGSVPRRRSTILAPRPEANQCQAGSLLASRNSAQALAAPAAAAMHRPGCRLTRTLPDQRPSGRRRPNWDSIAVLTQPAKILTRESRRLHGKNWRPLRFLLSDATARPAGDSLPIAAERHRSTGRGGLLFVPHRAEQGGSMHGVCKRQRGRRRARHSRCHGASQPGFAIGYGDDDLTKALERRLCRAVRA